MIYQIKKDIYYDNYNKCYKKIIVISPTPDFSTEPYLKKITKLLHTEKISPYKEYNTCCEREICKYAFIDEYNNYLTINDLPHIFSLLTTNGFKIETEITKMMQNSSVKIKELVCFISK